MVCSEEDWKSVTCSIESTFLTRTSGKVDFVVVFKGNGRLNPQSPTIRDVEGVVTVRWVGKAVVAVSDLCFVADDMSPGGGAIGEGMENNRDERRRAAPGETARCVDAIVGQRGGMAVTSQRWWDSR